MNGNEETNPATLSDSLNNFSVMIAQKIEDNSVHTDKHYFDYLTTPIDNTSILAPTSTHVRYGDKLRLTYLEKLKNCKIKLYKLLTFSLMERLLMIHIKTPKFLSFKIISVQNALLGRTVLKSSYQNLP